jgi:hypothetical protein
MLKKSVGLVLLATVATAEAWTVPTALGQDAKTILNNVSKAMGADKIHYPADSRKVTIAELNRAARKTN